MRGQDARAMTRAKLDELGLHFIEAKTGKPRNIHWSETLAALIERCFDRNRARAKRYKFIESDYLFCGKSGRPLTESAVQSMLGRMKKQESRAIGDRPATSGAAMTGARRAPPIRRARVWARATRDLIFTIVTGILRRSNELVSYAPDFRIC